MKTSYHSYKYLTEKYGISRNKLFSCMLQDFFLHSSQRVALAVYETLLTSGKHFHSGIYDGTYIHEGIQYAILYQGCGAFEAKCSLEIEISFRAAVDDFNLQPICIVRIPA